MVKKFQINLTNKWFYTFVAIGVFILLGVGVYAFGGNTPNIMGHSINEIASPSGCEAGQVLTWAGSSWGCVDMASGDGTIIQSKLQCPPRRMVISTIDINDNKENGFASYENCVRAKGYVELSNPSIKKRNDEHSIVVNLDTSEDYAGDYCGAFCRLFGFENGECTELITQTPESVRDNPNFESACWTQAFKKDEDPFRFYVRTGWIYYCKECETCRCFI